jgi:hypothetical protein
MHSVLFFSFVYVFIRPVYVVFVFSFALVVVRLWLQQKNKKKETVRHNKNIIIQFFCNQTIKFNRKKRTYDFRYSFMTETMEFSIPNNNKYLQKL